MKAGESEAQVLNIQEKEGREPRKILTAMLDRMTLRNQMKQDRHQIGVTKDQVLVQHHLPLIEQLQNEFEMQIELKEVMQVFREVPSCVSLHLAQIGNPPTGLSSVLTRVSESLRLERSINAERN